MKYLLDTNTCIRYINGRAPKIYDYMRAVADSDIAISTITQAEMYAGSAKSQTPQQSRDKQDNFFVRFRSLTFDEGAADAFGRIRAALESAGTPIGPYDMQIGAIALVHNLILVTHNVSEFQRIPVLQIEDWEV
ncbi:MAG: type II toxin-antitoxin system VapC family toxin [Armatimonadetes bacterium]|nr:type II toxin-antitoxin system VapC family toxin [Anaerolineae bacterium]